jgi:hypothetical protein
MTLGLPLRLALFLSSWILAIAAGFYRLARWSERPAEEEESWFLLFCYLGTLAAYTGWRVLVLADGSEWQWGWRR